jgi:hypothetical protein
MKWTAVPENKFEVPTVINRKILLACDAGVCFGEYLSLLQLNLAVSNFP